MRGVSTLALALPVMLSSQMCWAQPAVRVMRLEETRIAFPEEHDGMPEPRVNRAYFDATNALRWDDRAVHQEATGDCDTPSTWLAPNGRRLFSRRTRMLGPRVDERRCPRSGRPGTDIALVGFDADGRVKWQRPLMFRSGEYAIDQTLIGTTPEGLVLSDLEVCSPSTGETIVPARTHRSGGPESRPVPDHHFVSSALYHPKRNEFLVFDAEVTLVHREGGLYRIDARTGAKELLWGVAATLIGTYDRVEEIALSRNGNFVLLAQREAVRGPSSVSVAVLDLEAGRRVFEQRHGRGHACAAPQVLAGDDGHVGFAYRDEHTREHVLVHYRLMQ